MKKNYTFEEIVNQIKIKNFGNILFDITIVQQTFTLSMKMI